MPGRAAHALTVALAVAAVSALTSSAAVATTICVPNFHGACPSGGGNVAESDVEKAMLLDGEDGVPDTVVIAAGTFAETGSFEPPSGNEETIEPYGDDPLTIVGAGPAATILTTTAADNVFVVNFSSSDSRPSTVRDLTVRVPAAFPDGQGGALQLSGTVLENVDIVSLNFGSDGVGSANGPGNVFRDGELRGEAGGAIDVGFKANFDAELLVEDTTIHGASWALHAGGPGSDLIARRVRGLGGGAYAVAATAGTATVENSVFTLDDAIGLYASAAADDAAIMADHVTIVDHAEGSTALEAKKFGGGAGDAGVTVSNSILRGFAAGYKAEATIGPGIGFVGVTARFSNLPAGGTSVNGNIDVDDGNIDVDPVLAADLTPPPGSPSIDAGDPAAGGLGSDFLGAARPADGNGDGVARRDQGAFEYQPPAPPAEPATPGDSTPPQTRIGRGPGTRLAAGVARFRFRSSEARSTFTCRLDRRKAAGCRSPKAYGRLKPGRHVFRVWATDAAGNRDPSPAKRRFRVPARPAG